MRKRSVLRHNRGVTLIELVVTIAVLAILVTLAVPSFRGLSERRALKGVADGIVGAIAQAKEEAIKRDQDVRVDFATFGNAVCVGATTAAAACDCATAGSCPVVAYPSQTSDLRMVKTRTAPAFGGAAGFEIDPKTGMLDDPTDAGELELETPLGYAVKVQVNAMARARMCSSGTKPIPGVKTCA